MNITYAVLFLCTASFSLGAAVILFFVDEVIFEKRSLPPYGLLACATLAISAAIFLLKGY